MTWIYTYVKGHPRWRFGSIARRRRRRPSAGTTVAVDKDAAT